MKLKISIWRVLASACICITLATSSGFWSDLAAATRTEPVVRLALNTRPKPQPLNGQNLQRSLDRNDVVDVI
ncbi:hypothetical protein [Chamaesiphon minutus]|uniref:Uncharacterized protein n=1 Tax=Chamaesiphon minutus (strain ATCC 27169 / PCC 6605) TaxID=1173020 RepID=K9UEN7_CHAP6|nr:hypothetical protein [Chamaesiphon minutus]AFY93265.1 hypothetical protein Cha6605_2181 [Chamaesiphon minutus PCC 6605]